MNKGEKLIFWVNEYKMPDTMGHEKAVKEMMELAKKGIMTFPSFPSHIMTDIGNGQRALMIMEFLKKLTDEEFEEALFKS